MKIKSYLQHPSESASEYISRIARECVEEAYNRSKYSGLMLMLVNDGLLRDYLDEGTPLADGGVGHHDTGFKLGGFRFLMTNDLRPHSSVREAWRMATVIMEQGVLLNQGGYRTVTRSLSLGDEFADQYALSFLDASFPDDGCYHAAVVSPHWTDPRAN